MARPPHNEFMITLATVAKWGKPFILIPQDDTSCHVAQAVRPPYLAGIRLVHLKEPKITVICSKIDIPPNIRTSTPRPLRHRAIALDPHNPAIVGRLEPVSVQEDDARAVDNELLCRVLRV